MKPNHVLSLAALGAALSTFIPSALTLPLTTSSPASTNPRLRTIHQFPNSTWIENIAVRRDGKLLVTLITSPEVHLIDPATSSPHGKPSDDNDDDDDSHNPNATLAYRFPSAHSASGIAEVLPDLFAVAAGEWDVATASAVPGSWSVWTLDYRGQLSRTGKPVARKVVAMPDAQFLNGVTALPSRPGSVLVSDSDRGVVYRVDALAGGYEVVIESEAFRPNGSARVELGVNGIRLGVEEGSSGGQGMFLYFTNSLALPTLARFPLKADGSAAGPYQTIVGQPSYPVAEGTHSDDFALDGRGNVYMTTDPSGEIVQIRIEDGKQTVVAGGLDKAEVEGDTAAAFGRTERDRNVLYVVTNGGLARPPPMGVTGGKVLAFDTAGL